MSLQKCAFTVLHSHVGSPFGNTTNTPPHTMPTRDNRHPHKCQLRHSLENCQMKCHARHRKHTCISPRMCMTSPQDTHTNIRSCSECMQSVGQAATCSRWQCQWKWRTMCHDDPQSTAHTVSPILCSSCRCHTLSALLH